MFKTLNENTVSSLYYVQYSQLQSRREIIVFIAGAHGMGNQALPDKLERYSNEKHNKVWRDIFQQVKIIKNDISLILQIKEHFGTHYHYLYMHSKHKSKPLQEKMENLIVN